MRPRMWISPDVGVVMFDSSFSAVLLPAPLWPMMPSASPARYNETHVAKRPELAARDATNAPD